MGTFSWCTYTEHFGFACFLFTTKVEVRLFFNKLYSAFSYLVLVEVSLLKQRHINLCFLLLCTFPPKEVGKKISFGSPFLVCGLLRAGPVVICNLWLFSDFSRESEGHSLLLCLFMEDKTRSKLHVLLCHFLVIFFL